MTIIEYFKNNWQWFLGSGGVLGTVILLISLFHKKAKETKITMQQKTGKNSVSIQIGGNINNGQ